MTTARADVGIANGRIVSIGAVAQAREEISATGLLVLPGGVDGHTHLDFQRAPGAAHSPDDYFFGTVAAACGGITTIVDYAKQQSGQSLAETVDSRRRKAEGQAVVDYGFHLIPTDLSVTMLDEIPRVFADGYPSLKIFMQLVDDPQMLRLLRTVGAAGGLTMVHCENAAINEDAMRRVAPDGEASVRSYADAIPIASELEGTRRAISFCAYTGAPICLVHVSAAEAVASIRLAKADSLPLWAETRPCYLMLTRERYSEPDPRHLMYTGYPPLREQDSVDALWVAARAGVIDTVASDHAAYTIEQKRVGDRDITKLPRGLPSLETQLGALYSEGVRTGRIGLDRFVALMSSNPARLLGMYPRKGAIAVGSDADLVLLDPNMRKTVHAEDMHSRAGYEPLEGMTFVGWPIATIARGEVIVRNGTFVGSRGRGELVRRKTFSVEDAEFTSI